MSVQIKTIDNAFVSPVSELAAFKHEGIRGIYKFGSVIGRGSQAYIRMAMNRQTHQRVAIKIIKKTELDLEALESLRAKCQMMVDLDHQNIVTIQEIFEDEKYHYMVMDLMKGGELYQELVEKSYFEEEDARKIITQIVKAVDYCHERGIVHRDIKLENILLSDPDPDLAIVKLTDFGFSKQLKNGELANSICGTPTYVAPEIISGIPYSFPCDMWSIGVILYMLVVGEPAFDTEDLSQMYKLICNGEYDQDFAQYLKLSDEVKCLIKQLLTVDQTQRITCKEILDHPWFNTFKSAKKPPQISYSKTKPSQSLDDLKDGDDQTKAQLVTPTSFQN